MNFKRSDFPEDFVFGAATSAYQIEGHAVGGAGSTHWDTFAATPGNVVRSEHGQLACDHTTIGTKKTSILWQQQGLTPTAFQRHGHGSCLTA